jgi:hypothetical protein
VKLSLPTILSLAILTCCISQYELDTEINAGQLIVDGRITNLNEQEPISVLRTNSVGTRDPVSNAVVSILVDSKFEYFLTENTPGKYYFPPLVNGKPGHLYQLKVLLSNGKLFESKAEMMPDANGSGTSTFEVINKEIVDLEGTVVNRAMIKIINNVSLERPDLFLRWDVIETYIITTLYIPISSALSGQAAICFITNRVGSQSPSIINGNLTKKRKDFKVEILEREIDDTFAERHIFSIYQTSITKDSFEYWQKVSLLLSQQGSIFDTPPAPIVGNIYNSNNSKEYVLGFFEAANITVNRFDVFPFNIPFYTAKKCTYDPSKEFYPKECTDCIGAGGNYNPPSWLIVR